MNRAADVRSVESIRSFRADLVEYQGKLRQAIELLGVELSRGEGWFRQQTAFWPSEARRSSDRLAEARAALGRCMLGKGKERASACDDERAAMNHAKRRLSFSEEQIRVTKGWCLEISQDADEFRNGLSRVIAIVEGDIPKALSLLDKIIESLERYTEQQRSSTPVQGGSTNGDGLSQSAQDVLATKNHEKKATTFGETSVEPSADAPNDVSS